MSTAVWGIFGWFLVLAVLLGWLVLRDMARRGQDPEEENRRPGWWEGSPPDSGGLRAAQAESILDILWSLPTTSAGVPWLAPEPAAAA